MSIKLVDRKMLWGRSGGKCAFCKIPLTTISDVGHASVIGEEAHIVAREPNGPRGDSPLDSRQRDNYSNLILLCPTRHSEIDKVPSGVSEYSVERLLQIKNDHERSVAQFDGSDSRDQVSAEQWAYVIDQLEERMGWADWTRNTGSIFGPDAPTLSLKMHERLHNLSKWIFSRVWPEDHRQLREVIETMNYVILDFLQTFDEHAEQYANSEYLRTDKFYKISEWNNERYSALLGEYKNHVTLVRDLALEMTRYANWISTKVRDEIDPMYRFEEGVLTVRSDDLLRWQLYRPEFSAAELEQGQPYKGPEEFRIDRSKRQLRIEAL
ncbi:HNH endonuclease signature motif containing protein [Nocardia niwae]|uniref:HNH endonuclease signature motif containing protein n=1 Tax=Nocardia niwae TaxID=626084 RepID=A0ABV2XJ62_9NOCA